MKKSELIHLLSIVLLFVSFIIFIYFFIFLALETIGYSRQNTIFTMFLSSIIILIFAFIIAKHSIMLNQKTKDTILKLTKNVLHEINIPISTIKGNSYLIQQNLHSEQNIERLKRVDLASENLIEYYKELEYILKKELEKPSKEIFDFEEILNSEIKIFQDLRKDITFSLKTKKIFLYCDKRGFKKIIDNLLSNAIKYNKKNGYVSIVLEDNILTIEDSGIGIDSQKIVHIFNRYFQADETKDGEGIGLNIVKDYCDENKIPIKIQSNINIGTKIILDLKQTIYNG